MDDSSITDGDAVTMGPSVASLLGIKDPIRFRPHGSTQKAHVILRRVTVADDATDNGETSHVVRFSLFAQKRIEVKPGKEILLAIASVDGRFKDQPIVFEGDISCSTSASDEEDKTQVAEEEDILLPTSGGAIPPKMRRAWTKKADEGSFAIPIRPTVTYSSIGIQAEPSFVSTSTQAQPPTCSIALQTTNISVSTSVQVDPPLVQISSAVQTIDSGGNFDSIVRTDETPITRQEGNLSKEIDQNPQKERSLSPMELDSPVQTPTFSPTFVPDINDEMSLSPSYSPEYSPASATSSIASSSGAQDMQMSPIDLKPSSSSTRFLQSSILLGPSAPPKVNSIDTRSDVERRPGKTEDHPVEPPHMSMVSQYPPESTYRPPVESVPKPISKPVVRAKQEVRNPFVSAGFMTEFVGPVDGLTTQEKMKTASELAKPLTPLKVLTSATELAPLHFHTPEPKLAVPAPTRGGKSPPSVSPSAQSSQPPPPPSERPRSPPSKSPLVADNAVASSSKLALERTAPHSFSHQLAPPSGPRSLSTLSSRAREKSPVTSGHWLGPRPSVPSKPLSPPPEPKSLAYIPSGPSSNPLNIRPSSNVLPYSAVQQKVSPTIPKVQSQPASKKRVVVGTGWPFVKATNGSVPPVPHQPLTPAPQQPGPPIRPSYAIPPTELSTVLPYSSPSPPPSTPISKWKRVNNDVLPSPPATNASPSSSSATSQSYPLVNDRKIERSGKSNVKTGSSVMAETPRQAMSLVDRISPVAATSSKFTTRSNLKNGRDLRSRISDPPLPTPQIANIVEASRSRKEALLPTGGRKHALPLPQLPTVVSQTLAHPLPNKPSPTPDKAPNRMKRERALTPDLTAEPVRRKKRTFRWPTVDSNYSVGLKGEGELCVRNISFSSDGNHFALSCADKTIRIWNNRERTEIARLSHNSPVVTVSWMDGDTGVVSLGEDGIVSKWTRSGQNHWQWAKVLDAGNERRSEDDQVCLAYRRDRIAVSFPRTGVKVWVWSKGTWQSQRSILRQNVSAIQFVEDGAALVGGTRDGVLWYCEIPNGTLRAYAFLKSKINSLDLNPTGSHVLVGQVGGCARLVGIRQPDNRGSVEQSYSCKETEARPNGGFGALFATQGQAILFGSVEGCVLVWDRKKGAIVYGLEHDEDDLIQAVASFDGATNREGCLVTGTKGGHLAWWSQPVAAPQSDDTPHKRAKLV